MKWKFVTAKEVALQTTWALLLLVILVPPGVCVSLAVYYAVFGTCIATRQPSKHFPTD